MTTRIGINGFGRIGRLALRAINQGLETDLPTGLKIEGLCLGACFASKDSKEGLNAFLEKRKPKYEGL